MQPRSAAVVPLKADTSLYPTAWYFAAQPVAGRFEPASQAIDCLVKIPGTEDQDYFLPMLRELIVYNASQETGRKIG